MKANPDLWEAYRKLLSYRKQAPKFIWVRGHSGHLHNERADELAGLGAWNNDREAFDKWQTSQAPEARNGLPSAQLAALREQVQKLKALFDSIAGDNPQGVSHEREIINYMAKHLRKTQVL